MTLQGIRLDPDGGDVVDALHMVDISRSGMGAHTERSFYPGQRIVLCLPLSDQGGRRNIYATVIRCNKKDEKFRVGLEFDTTSLNTWRGSSDSVAAA
jgi:hypothetical protein